MYNEIPFFIGHGIVHGITRCPLNKLVETLKTKGMIIMPKIAKELKPMEVAKLKGDGLYAVGGVPGLYLKIDGNSRSWVFRTHITGKEQKMGVGACSLVTLAEARDKAREMHKKIRDGINPTMERKAAKARAALEAAKIRTFRQCAEKYFDSIRAGLDVSHVRKVEKSLELHVYPIIGDLQIADIDTGLVLEVLQQPVDTADGKKPFWEAKTETASKLRGRVEAILQWAKVCGHRTGENPADWKTLKYTLPAPSKVYRGKNHPALAYSEIGVFMSNLRKSDGILARCLEFTILTAARSREVRLATWDEIDFDERVWTVPAEHMKTKKEHHVALSDEAVSLLESLPRSEGNNHIFPPERANELSDMALLMVIRRMHRSKLAKDGKGWIDPKIDNRVITAHGFRATFKTWATLETAHPREVIEHALSHQFEGKVEAAYLRGEDLRKRGALMNDWAQYCNAIPTVKGNNVVSIRKAVSHVAGTALT